jgi:hypothetical protein
MDREKFNELKLKYLPNKKVYVKAIVRESSMVKDPKHIAWGGMEGTVSKYVIGRNENGGMNNPFKSDEEQEFFEMALNEKNLSVFGENPYWDTTHFKVIKDAQLINAGIPFDMSNPKDSILIKILLTNEKIAVLGWENRDNLPTYKYAVIEEGHEEAEAAKKANKEAKKGIFLGRLSDSTEQLKNFLNIYYSKTGKEIQVSDAMSKEALIAEVYKVMTNDEKTFIELAEDKLYDVKVFIAKCIDRRVINKTGTYSYMITGIDRTFTYLQLVDEVEKLMLNKDPLYVKMLAMVDKK